MFVYVARKTIQPLIPECKENVYRYIIIVYIYGSKKANDEMHYAYKYIMSYCMVCIIFAQVVLASIDVIQKYYVKRTSIKLSCIQT